jgi:hypothetical protein
MTFASVSSVGIETLERSAQRAYSQIADSYYSTKNPTTRLFDMAIARYLDLHPPLVGQRGYYAEIGSGRTGLNRFFSSTTSALILVDISRKMIHHSQGVGAPCFHFLIGSAFWLPFKTSAFSGIYSFLGDAFNTDDYFREVRRTLLKNGEFIHIVPDFLWAETLRKEIGIPLNETYFPHNQGSKVFAPSIVWSDDKLRNMIFQAGFTKCNLEHLYVPREAAENQLSSHILIPSRKLRVSPYDMPFLTVLRAEK